MVPSASFASAAIPPGSSLAVPGMLKAIQCVTSSIFFPMETSGSWNSSTKLSTPAGTLVHCSFGETAAAPAFMVNLSGITAPSSISGDVSVKPGPWGPLPPPLPLSCERAAPALSARTTAVVERTFLIICILLPGGPLAVLAARNKVQRSRVHAIAQVSGRRTIVEDMHQMTVAPGAQHFIALHPV